MGKELNRLKVNSSPTIRHTQCQIWKLRYGQFQPRYKINTFLGWSTSRYLKHCRKYQVFSRATQETKHFPSIFSIYMSSNHIYVEGNCIIKCTNGVVNIKIQFSRFEIDKKYSSTPILCSSRAGLHNQGPWTYTWSTDRYPGVREDQIKIYIYVINI